MIHSSVRSGFSLIEVVIALAVMGIMLVTLFALQQTVLQTTFTQADTLRRMLLIKNTLYDPELMRELSGDSKKVEHKVKEPLTTITMESVQEINKLFRDLPLDVFTVTARWQDMFGDQTESAMALRVKPPESKGSKKK